MVGVSLGKKRGVSSLKRKLLPILKRNEVIKAGIFGSFARGESTSESDLDILVEFKPGKNLLDLVGLKIEIEDKLGYKSDVLTYKYIYPPLKKRILSEEIRIL